jgi:alpha-tubulin suppressor-like RCC1 family protein
LWAMGYNMDGELGDGGNSTTNLPEQTLFAAHSTVVSAIAAGSAHTLLIKPDGSLWANGSDEYVQLGDGNSGMNAKVTSPVEIMPGNVTAIAAGVDHSLFLMSDGSLWAMGHNDYGQLCDGSTNDSHSPKLILSSNVTAISAGGYDSLFLKSDGSLWAVGYNHYGELGDGTTSNRLSPVEIVPGSVTAISAGALHSLFLKSDGSLWGMGQNNSGQLGDGTYNDAHLPELISGPPPALAITTYSNQPVILFPTGPAYGFVLQMTTNLASSNWVTVTNGIPFSGVQITNAPAAAFFRFY